MQQSRLTDFYERQVLPELFERLDRAFPEFQFTRSGQGWSGTKPEANSFDRRSTSVSCQQAWGFTDSRGLITSWLVYVNGGTRPTGRAFVDAIGRLAKRAGLDDAFLRECSLEQHHEAERHERQREILEAFVAYCNAALADERGRELRNSLERDFGVDTRNVMVLPIGMFTNQQDVADHLVALGFTRDEVSASWLVGDNRIAGRLVIPWRDRWGSIRTIVAKDLLGQSRLEGRDLYLRGRHQTEGFGLDVALRARAGGRSQLVLCDSLLDVIAWHSQGDWNVATFANRGGVVSADQWERLVDCGVETATLLAGESEAELVRTSQSIRQANRAARSPQVFVVSDSRGSLRDSAYGHGAGQFQGTTRDRRVHGYRYAANALLRQIQTHAELSDAQWLDLVQEAIKFDAEVLDRERIADLDRHFWPPIVDATGLTWDGLRGVLGRVQPVATHSYVSQPVISHPVMSQPVMSQPTTTRRVVRRWTLHNLSDLVAELRQALTIDDVAGFKLLLVSAVRDLELDVSRPVQRLETVVETRSDPVSDDLLRLRQRRAMQKSNQVGWDAVSTVRYPVAAPVSYSTGPWLANDEVAEILPPMPKSRPLPRMPRSPSLGDIRRLAYSLWEKRGKPVGMDQQFWFEAEEALKLATHFESPVPQYRAA